MRQKFRQHTFVKVTGNMPPTMAHFDKGFIGIVCGTYSQAYGGKDIDSYCLYKLKDGKIVDRVSWYQEDQLTALPKAQQSRTRAENLVEAYNFR